LRERFAQPGSFVVAAEVVTGRAPLGSPQGAGVLALARGLAEDPRVDVLSITDNPGGNSMLAPEAVAGDAQARGQDVIVHLACKDTNRSGLKSRGWQLGSSGFHNVLAVSGDYPVAGTESVTAPVFDIDSVGLLHLYAGLEHTDFFLGCVVTNHKRFEREVMPQYFKLRKKAAAGARFVIKQIGWNARKDDELLRFIRREQLPLHALANVFLLTRASARAFHRGRIPGVVVTDSLLELVERYGGGDDHGRSFFIDLAARHIAVGRGLGYAGVYLGGHMPASTFGEILDRAGEYDHDDWRALTHDLAYEAPDEFYLFERDQETGLSSDRLNAVYVDSKVRRRTDLRVPFSYRVNRRVHNAVFAASAPLFPAGRAIYGAAERGPRAVGKSLHLVEQGVKVPLFRCRDCGDCSLPDIAYVCPESQCAKNQRNGPCGGTRDGLCEVYDSECIWSQAYERLKAYGEEETMLDGPVVIRDNALRGTSAWANAFLGRDHNAERPPKP
jgi:methylenetetrahydrofolate reductase (NADPH)